MNWNGVEWNVCVFVCPSVCWSCNVMPCHVCMSVCLSVWIFSSKVYALLAMVAGLLGQVPHSECFAKGSKEVDIEWVLVIFMFLVVMSQRCGLNQRSLCPLWCVCLWAGLRGLCRCCHLAGYHGKQPDRLFIPVAEGQGQLGNAIFVV